MRNPPANVGLLRQREYRLLLCGQAVSLFGDGMANVALAFAVLELDHSPSALGLVFACKAFAVVGCLLIGGVAADRVSRRALMVGADLVRMATQGALAAMLLAGTGRLWMIAVLAAVGGAANGFFAPASTGLLPDVVAPEHVQQANGFRATAGATGRVVGPVVAGAVVGATSAGWALAIDAATFAFSAACLSRLRVRPVSARESGSFVNDLSHGWAVVRSRAWVWTLVGATAIGNMVFGAWSVLGPVVADRKLGGAAAWGAVVGAMGAGAVVGGLLAIRVDPRRPLVSVALANAVVAAPLALLAAGAGVPLLALGALVSGAAITFSNSLWESTLQRHIPRQSVSRVSAYERFGSLAFAPVGLAVWGPIAATIGIEASLWLASALFIASALGLLAVPAIQRLPRTPSGAGDRL